MTEYDEIRAKWDKQNEEIKAAGKWDEMYELLDKESRSRLAHMEAMENNPFPI